ncbi:MAG TPA: TonB-dependent receptor [Steroidobacter sp.]
MRRPTKVKSALLALACSFALTANAQEDSPKAVDVPAGDLIEAIELLVRQSGVEVIYRPEQLKGLQTGGVQGRLTAAAAISKLLEGTPLSLSADDSGVLLIAPISQARPGEALGSPSSSAASDNPMSLPAVEEIIVTARKRAERLQDVPQSIQALSGEELRKQGALNFADYARTVAGVSFLDDGPGRSQLFIRGVSTGGDVDTGKESTVGVYIDETPVTEGSSQPDLRLYDIDRVEVLRGPQGTLYGSGSLGGTVRILTNQPSFIRTEAHVEIEGSSTKSGGLNGATNAWLNLPVSDRAALRAVAYGIRNSGFLDNSETGESDINDESTHGGRLAFRVQPTEAVNIVLTGMHQRSDSGAYNRHSGDYPRLVLDQREPEPFEDRFSLANLKVEADLGFAALSLSSSYFDRQRDFENDIDYFIEAQTGVPRGRSALEYGARSKAQELRLTSQGEGALQWLIGAFHVDRDEQFGQTIHFRGVPTPGSSSEFLFFAATDGGIEQLAGFGEVSYAFFGKLTATAGLRVSKVDRDVAAFRDGLAFGGVGQLQSGSFSETSRTPKFNLSYKIDGRKLIYVQAAEGFRIGGVNPGLPPCPTCLADLGASFSSDSLWSYEVGWRSELLQETLTFNASAFWIDWEDIQLNVNREDGFNGFTNAGKARSRGVEMEINARASDHVRVGGQVTYTDAELTSLNRGLEQIATIGAQLPQVPRWSAAANAEWATAVGANGRLYVRGDVQYQGSRINMLGANTVRLDDYIVSNLRIGFDYGRWGAALFVNNLTDERAQLDRNIVSGVRDGAPITLDRYTINTPMTFGISLSARY